MNQQSRAENDPMKIGLVGLGLVGTAMAQRLIPGGMQVVGYDTDKTAQERLLKLGGSVAATASEAVQAGPIVLMSLPDGRIVKSVIDQCLAALLPGTIIIDTTTASPTEVMDVHRRLQENEIEYLDATISGSSYLISKGQATWMVGGADKAFHQIIPVLNVIGGVIHHTGPTGSGTRLKLISNLILGLNRAVLAEGLALAEFWGMNLVSTLDVLKSTAAYSRVMDAKGEKMISRDYEPQARLKQHHKDVLLMLQAVAGSEMKLYLSELHDDLLFQAEAAGFGELDNAAIIELWRTEGNHQKVNQKKSPEGS